MNETGPAQRHERTGRRLAQRLSLALILAACAGSLPPVSSGGTPRQIHLSWERPSTRFVSVMWVTRSASTRSRVRYGRTPSLELGAVEASTTSVPGDRGSFLHHAVLGPLDDRTRYSYAVGDDMTGWSSVHHFTSAPPAGHPVTFAAAADMGLGTKVEANAVLMAQAEPAFVIHLGDLSYAEGDPDDWDTWFRSIEPVASRTPYMTSIGNHEYESTTGLDAYLGRLALPNNERFYSFDCGLLHVIVLESGKEYGPPSPEVTSWLQSDLEESSRDPRRPWTVVGFHFPPFSSGNYGSWTAGREAWSPLFDRYGVDLVLSGHVHAYERSWPVDASGRVARRDYESPRAPVYVVTGGSGAYHRLHPFPPQPPPEWSAFRVSENETLRITVDAERMTVTAIHPEGREIDSFTITREAGVPEAHATPSARPGS